MVKKTKIEKTLNHDRVFIGEIVEGLGYKKRGNIKGFIHYYKPTRFGRIHIIINPIPKNRCKIKIHHDISSFHRGMKGITHYTRSFDPIPISSWRKIEEAIYEKIKPVSSSIKNNKEDREE